MSVSNQAAVKASQASLFVNGQINNRNTTWAWMQAPAGGVAWQFQLQDYAVASGPIWNIGSLVSLTGYDEVFVYVFNLGGQSVIARFGWSAENLSADNPIGAGPDGIADDLGNDYGYPSQSASAVVAGSHDGQGNGVSVLRFPTLPVEYGPLLGSAAFRLQVKGPCLMVGLATNGVPNANQKVLVQVVPRTIGVPRSGA